MNYFVAYRNKLNIQTDMSDGIYQPLSFKDYLLMLYDLYVSIFYLKKRTKTQTKDIFNHLYIYNHGKQTSKFKSKITKK